MRYTVTAERGSTPVWVLQCREVPDAVSESRRLAEAESLMVEAIAFVAEVDAEDVEIDLLPLLPEPLSSEVSAARALVKELSDLQQGAAAASRRAARDLIAAGLTGVDAALVLSPQRVSQLVGNSHEAA